ncbi:type II secretion system F family protein [Modestobacter sp. VKM Ac-2985]|uniref:type II secretion system F family protein n=1 Tax=Modestobacter sp. VKM Ac-2985 TaxID=3004139 RepID=UPI0022ABC14D|nr:type II secretion system F family protein [Modestobacter sp. VKM Ac-2985]MCZ2836807.1 type II secretion system F family protein [Modestobacter sp. VKM Ac-2985]
MPVLVWAAVAALILPLAVGAQFALTRPGRAAAVVRENLTHGLVAPGPEEGTLEARRTGSGALLRTLTAESVARRVRRMLDVAGRPSGFTMTRLLWAKLWLPAVVALLGGWWQAEAPSAPGALAVLAGVVLAHHLPEAVLWSRGQERQEQIGRELPDVLDQMMIAVEAGLGFDAAFARAASTGRSVFAEELLHTQHDLAAGRPRRAAYDALAARTRVPDLKRFIGAVNQAETYGVPVADVLRVQADELRVKRRQRAEEQAMKVPVKVTFPLMVCILPALLIVLLGPAALGLLDSLG